MIWGSFPYPFTPFFPSSHKASPLFLTLFFPSPPLQHTFIHALPSPSFLTSSSINQRSVLALVSPFLYFLSSLHFIPPLLHSLIPPPLTLIPSVPESTTARSSRLSLAHHNLFTYLYVALIVCLLNDRLFRWHPVWTKILKISLMALHITVRRSWRSDNL